jgi:hypothetical protein
VVVLVLSPQALGRGAHQLQRANIPLPKVRGVAFPMKHGDNRRGKRTREYEIWAGMRKRCYNQRDKLYPYYGGRGIRMCDSWYDSYIAFLSDMGRSPSPKHSLDRIDNDGNYEPGNVRWATRSEQMLNTRRNRLVTFAGVTLPLKAWCDLLGVNYKKAHNRIVKLGWAPEVALKVA